jgi:hypothetical protein
MRPLLEAYFRQILRSKGKNLPLIHATKLRIHTQMLLVKRLHKRVDQTAKQRARDLFDDLGTGLLRIVFRDDTRQL